MRHTVWVPRAFAIAASLLAIAMVREALLSLDSANGMLHLAGGVMLSILAPIWWQEGR